MSCRRFRCIVKPTREDASIGISRSSVVHDARASWRRSVAEVLARYRQPVLVERYIDGRELYVSLLGNGDAPDGAADARDRLLDACPPIAPRIVSYDGKWDPVVGGVPGHALGAREG